MQHLFAFLAPRNLNLKTLELFFSLNQRLSIWLFGRRVKIRVFWYQAYQARLWERMLNRMASLAMPITWAFSKPCLVNMNLVFSIYTLPPIQLIHRIYQCGKTFCLQFLRAKFTRNSVNNTFDETLIKLLDAGKVFKMILCLTVQNVLEWKKQASRYWRMRIGKLFSLFLIQNICCGYSKEPSRWDGSFEHPKLIFNLMGKKIIALLS